MFEVFYQKQNSNGAYEIQKIISSVYYHLLEKISLRIVIFVKDGGSDF